MNPVETDVPDKPSKKFPWGIYLIALFVILAVALAPAGSVVVCGWVANTPLPPGGPMENEND